MWQQYYGTAGVSEGVETQGMKPEVRDTINSRANSALDHLQGN